MTITRKDRPQFESPKMRIAAREPCRVMVAALYAQAQPGRTPRAAGSAFRVGVGRVRVGARHRHGPS